MCFCYDGFLLLLLLLLPPPPPACPSVLSRGKLRDGVLDDPTARLQLIAELSPHIPIYILTLHIRTNTSYNHWPLMSSSSSSPVAFAYISRLIFFSTCNCCIVQSLYSYNYRILTNKSIYLIRQPQRFSIQYTDSIYNSPLIFFSVYVSFHRH